MTRIYIMAVIITAFTISCSAQDTDRHKSRFGIGEITKALSVDRTKAKEVLEAIEFNRAAIQETFQNKNLKMNVRREKLKVLYSERQARIKSLLSEEEQKKLDMLFLKEKEKHRAKREEIKKVEQEKLKKKAKKA